MESLTPPAGLENKSAWLTGAALATVIAISLACTWPGLYAYFTGDDIMNLHHLHGVLERPIAATVLDVLQPWNGAYRPLGGLFYHVMFALAGFHPLPYRAVCYTLLGANLALAFIVLRRLSGSREVALLGTLLMSYHAAMAELYFNTGTIYDILCCGLFLGTLTLYIAKRQAGGGFGLPALTALLILNVLAVEAKEMACTLPAVWLLYEVWYGSVWGLQGSGWSVLRRYAACLAGGVLTGTMLLVRVLTPNVVSDNPLYRPTLSLTYYLRSAARYQGMWLGWPDLLGLPGLVALWCALALMAASLRSRAMAFGLVFWALALFPVAVLPPRAGFVLYVPALGMALYAGALLVHLRRAIAHTLHLPQAVSQAALFSLVMGGWTLAYSARISSQIAPLVRVQRDMRELAASMQSRNATLVPHARVLFLDDPFGSDSWILMFAMQLLFRDPTIRVDIARHRPHARAYDYVFAYTDGQLSDFGPRPAQCPPPNVLPGAIDDSSAGLCWTGDWTSEGFAEATDGTITHSNHADANVEIVFEGSALIYVHTRAHNRGLASIEIDGAAHGVVDLYSPTVGWRASTAFRGLHPGRHRAVLRVLGRHNSAATDSIVDVDGFVIER